MLKNRKCHLSSLEDDMFLFDQSFSATQWAKQRFKFDTTDHPQSMAFKLSMLTEHNMCLLIWHTKSINAISVVHLTMLICSREEGRGAYKGHLIYISIILSSP